MSLILMNDDINTFDYIIMILSTFLPMCNKLQSTQIAQLTHKSGRCEIYSGFAPEIFILYAQLQKAGLTVKLKQHNKNENSN